MNDKITFHQLADDLSTFTGGTQATAENFIKEFFATISETLKEGENVKIKGFGTFLLSEHEENPVHFIPDKEFADAINMPFSCFEAVELKDDITEDILNSAETTEAQSLPNKKEMIKDCDSAILVKDKRPETETTENDTPQNTPGQLIASTKTNECNDTTAVTEHESHPVVDLLEIEDENEDGNGNGNKDENSISHHTYYWAIASLCLVIGMITGYFLNPVFNRVISIEKGTVATPVIPTVVIDTIDNKNDSTAIVPIEEKITQPVVVYDTIGRNRFLTTMSREYYGIMEFWVYIYEENKDKLSDPNRIKPGTAIVIPPAEKYDINKDDPDCVNTAKLKAIEIYAPYQK